MKPDFRLMFASFLDRYSEACDDLDRTQDDYEADEKKYNAWQFSRGAHYEACYALAAFVYTWHKELFANG